VLSAVEEVGAMIAVIDEDECLALLTATTVGRVGFMHDGRIEIIPVNYRVHGRDVLVRTRESGILAALPDQPHVAFEVDHHDDLGGTAWSVLLSGHVENMTPEQAKEAPATRRHVVWAGDERSLWLRFVTDRVSGRRVRRPQG
jgi:nitroimidazol reductase NimA-like FMN-containing flavoprotein (pyridoxamine 5'-phosphate oxidase superfamily)